MCYLPFLKPTNCEIDLKGGPCAFLKVVIYLKLYFPGRFQCCCIDVNKSLKSFILILKSNPILVIQILINFWISFIIISKLLSLNSISGYFWNVWLFVSWLIVKMTEQYVQYNVVISISISIGIFFMFFSLWRAQSPFRLLMI